MSDHRDSHEGNLDACLLSPRPIRVRKVVTSGMNGFGSGISCAALVLCNDLVCPAGRKKSDSGASTRRGCLKRPSRMLRRSKKSSVNVGQDTVQPGNLDTYIATLSVTGDD